MDSDVFITAKNLYYAFDICPGFWKCVVHHHRTGRIFSIDRVRSELLAGHKTEDLVQWVRTEVQKGFFILVVTDLVMSATLFYHWYLHPRLDESAYTPIAYAPHNTLRTTRRRGPPHQSRRVGLKKALTLPTWDSGLHKVDSC